ncbi:MAG: hypothetical protein M0T84_01485 [Betaproteobacteria bacterium]|nr:hypothetical protein [Betaproteobacteria bacterium]
MSYSVQSVGFTNPGQMQNLAISKQNAMVMRGPDAIASVLRNPMASNELRAAAAQRLQAAALDFQGPGAVEIGLFEREIVDLVRRNSILLARVRAVKASGQPHRYLEQTAIATGGFTDPRNIAPTATGPTRVENYATLKAIVAQSNLTQFDVAVTKAQGIFGDIEAQDIHDVASACIVTMGQAVWNGNDTSLSAPTTTQYMGILAQVSAVYGVNNPVTNAAPIAGNLRKVAPGMSIVDGIKAEVAAIMANEEYAAKPTAIYVNPILGDLIEREAKAMQIWVNDVEIIPGVTCRAIATQAGNLPLIPDPYLPATTAAGYGFAAPATGNSNYFAVVVTEDLIQRPYMPVGYESPWPQIFQLGLTGNLQGQFVAVQYDAILAKAASYAHGLVAVERPTGS